MASNNKNGASQGRRAGSGYSSGNGGDSGRSSRRKGKAGQGAAESEHQRFVRKYYPAFENLVLFVLGRGEWWRAFRAFLKREFSYRGAVIGRGSILLIATITFVIGGAAFFILGLFFLARDLTGSATIAAFIMVGGSMVLGFFFFLLTVAAFRKLFEPHPESRLARKGRSAEDVE